MAPFHSAQNRTQAHVQGGLSAAAANRDAHWAADSGSLEDILLTVQMLATIATIAQVRARCCWFGRILAGACGDRCHWVCLVQKMRCEGSAALLTGTTLPQYLSPYPVIRKIVKQNTTGNFSYIPYLANFLNATLTTVYGFLLRDNFIMLINRSPSTVPPPCSLHLPYLDFDQGRGKALLTAAPHGAVIVMLSYLKMLKMDKSGAF